MDGRILFTASTYSHIVHFHRPYLQALSNMGWQVDVACGGEPMPIPEADRVIHIPFEKRMTSPKNLRAVQLLRREIKEQGYALITCHTSLAAFFTRMAVQGMRGRPPVVCVAHGYLFDADTPPARRLLLSGAERLTAPVTDLLLTMNAWDTQYAQRHRLGREVAEIPGIGVDFSHTRPPEEGERGVLRRVLGFGEEDFLLIYPAEFSARKSQHVLLEALARLPEQVKLLLPGDGTQRPACIDQAQALGLSRRVAFPGQIPRDAGPGRDMSAWYAAADAAVSASRSEGLPFNIMEAMHHGLPVVASSVKGHQDLLRHGENGLLYPYGDSAACAGQITRLLTDRPLALRLGRQAAADSLAYSLDAVLPQVMDFYTRFLPVGPRRAGVPFS